MTLENMDGFKNKHDSTNTIWPNGNMKQDSTNIKAHKHDKIWKFKHKSWMVQDWVENRTMKNANHIFWQLWPLLTILLITLSIIL